jgi:NADH-quinone oxidoreductase subunit L
MIDLLWLVPALPFMGAVILILFGRKLTRPVVSLVGAGSVGLSALMTIIVGVDFLSSGETAFQQRLWQWVDVAGFSPSFAFYLDNLALVFIFVITFVGFLIHVYSTEFMAEDEGYARFFTYLNLFVASMLILVLADNLFLLYLGWEGVGLCSYLLIGFWYTEEKNGFAAQKAFIVTRIGDTAMAIGLFMLFQQLHTLNIQTILQTAPDIWVIGGQPAVTVAFLLLGGAVGKSAQLPLQTWLPDAMAGPSPVSALIHAATMVTAGVYLITRTFGIFELAPVALLCVGIIGAVTLLLAGFSALVQHDLKRVLAYSTISQIGYMFLALGVGAWSAAIFHFMIHAFFKALLFLGAGAVIMVLHHEHDMFRMGGLKNRLPLIYWTFLIGAASLAALPLVTAGFYSKDQILWLAWAGENGNVWFFVAALTGAFITSIYTFRMVFLTFFGEAKTPVGHHTHRSINIPLVILAILSLIAGFIELPHTLGHVTIFSDFLAPVLPETRIRAGVAESEWLMQIAAAIVSLSGVYVAYVLYLKNPALSMRLRVSLAPLHHVWKSGWGFDALYNTLFVRPFVSIARLNKHDAIDTIYDGLVSVSESIHRALSWFQSGILRWYITGIVAGAILILTYRLFI